MPQLPPFHFLNGIGEYPMFLAQTPALTRVVHFVQKPRYRFARMPRLAQNCVGVIDVGKAYGRVGQPHECHRRAQIGLDELDPLLGSLFAQTNPKTQLLRN